LLTFTALIVLVRLFGLIDIVIPFDDDLAPPAVPPLASGDATMPSRVPLLELAPDRNLIVGRVVELQLAPARSHLEGLLGWSGDLLSALLGQLNSVFERHSQFAEHFILRGSSRQLSMTCISRFRERQPFHAAALARRAGVLARLGR